MQVINCGSNTSYYCSQCCILISWNSRLIANLIFSVFDYYNLAIKHILSIILSYEVVQMFLCWFIFFFAFQNEWKSVYYFGILVICVLDSCEKIVARIAFKLEHAAALFSNKLFFNKFIYNSILSMIFSKNDIWYGVLYIQKENSFNETFSLTIVNNPL